MDILEFRDGAAWEHWLEDHHAERPEAWLRVAKRHADLDLIAIGDAADGAFCFGWIDGQRRAYDEQSFLQRYSPRRKASPWSKVNVDKVDALIAAGRLRTAGLAEVEAARADGRWTGAYEPQSTAEVPSDLAAALADDPVAHAAFDRLGKSERYAVMLPVLKATTPDARAKALAREIKLLVSRTGSSLSKGVV